MEKMKLEYDQYIDFEEQVIKSQKYINILAVISDEKKCYNTKCFEMKNHLVDLQNCKIDYFPINHDKKMHILVRQDRIVDAYYKIDKTSFSINEFINNWNISKSQIYLDSDRIAKILIDYEFIFNLDVASIETIIIKNINKHFHQLNEKANPIFYMKTSILDEFKINKRETFVTQAEEDEFFRKYIFANRDSYKIYSTSVSTDKFFTCAYKDFDMHKFSKIFYGDGYMDDIICHYEYALPQLNYLIKYLFNTNVTNYKLLGILLSYFC